MSVLRDPLPNGTATVRWARTRGSLLELLHPKGAPGGVCVLGSGLSAGDASPDVWAVPPDVVVIAPTAGETAEGRLRTMCQDAVRIVAPDGLVLVVARGRARRRADAFLRSDGLDRLEGPILITRRGALVSSEPDALRHVIGRTSAPGRQLALRSVARGTASAAGRYGRTLIAYGAPGTLVAGWLRSRDRAGAPGLAFVPSWRSNGGVVATLVGPAGVSLVAKVGFVNASADIAGAEARALALVAADAERAGVHVPAVVDVVELGDRRAAVLTGLAGVPVALERGRALDVAAALSAWLARWAASTSTQCDAGPLLDGLVLRPLAELEDALPRTYVARLRERVAAVGDDPAAVAAVHGDLTLWNVLRSEDGLAVVDWENASDRALPLMDLPYLLVDAVATRARSSDRAAAYAACFEPGGPRRSWASAIVERTREAAGVLEPWAGLAVDACWLGHAADERRRGAGAGSFLGILGRHASRST